MDSIPPLHTQRRKPWIETPLIESATLSKVAGCRVFLKLDFLQPSGSFKSRGIGNFILSNLSDPANNGKKLHFYSSSGGNAGLAAVVAARELGCACTVVVPLTTKQMMIDRLRLAGATDVLQHGASWFEADTYLRENFIERSEHAAAAPAEAAEGDGDLGKPGKVKNIYVHPFDHPLIWEGHSTIISEIARQLPAPPHTDEETRLASAAVFPADVIVCSVGGGGLFNGIIQGLSEYIETHTEQDAVVQQQQQQSKVNVLAVETKGADSLAYALQSGELKSLDAITSIANTLGALCVAPQTFRNAQQPPRGIEVTSVVASDADAARGVVRLADELHILVELACGVSIEVGLGVKLREAVKNRSLGPESRVVIIVCGGSGVTAEAVAEYRSKLAHGWV